MDYPTISEYTAHLRLDKASLRNYLTAAGISTQESDTFTELVQAALVANGALRCIYVQPDEPLGKDGIWIKRNTTVVDFDAVSTDGPYVDETVLAQTHSVSPLDNVTNYVVYFIQSVNDFYAVRYRSAQGTGTNILDTTTPVIYIYKYNKTYRRWDQKQSYTFNEFVGARGDAYHTYTSPTMIQRLWGIVNTNYIKCWAPDTDGTYLYFWGGYITNTNASLGYGRPDSKPVIRLGISSHNCVKIKDSTYGVPTDTPRLIVHNNRIYSMGFTKPGNTWGPGVYCTTSLTANDTTQDRYLAENPARRGSIISPYDGTNQVFQVDGGTENNSSGPHNLIGIDLDTHTRFLYHQRNGSGTSNLGYFSVNGYRRVGSSIYYVSDLAWNNKTKIHGKYSLTDVATAGSEVSRTTFQFNGDSLCYLDNTNNQLVFIPKYTGGSPLEWRLNLLGNTYTKDTVVLAQSQSNYNAYHTNLYTTNQFVSDLKYSFENAWFYGADTGYEKTLPVYYGDGTQWIKFKN